MIHNLKHARLLRTGNGASQIYEPDLDEIEEVDDYSIGTLINLRARIERSAGNEQRLLREVELDVVWRLLDCAIAAANRVGLATSETTLLETLREAVVAAHDLIGSEAAPSIAAACLNAVIDGASG